MTQSQSGRALAQAVPTPLSRHHLAPNVICLFRHDAKPIQNPATPSKLPRGVVPLSSRPRLMQGDLAEMRGPGIVRNHGVKVRLLRQYRDGDWEVETVDGFLILSDGIKARLGSAKPEHLHRIQKKG